MDAAGDALVVCLSFHITRPPRGLGDAMAHLSRLASFAHQGAAIFPVCLRGIASAVILAYAARAPPSIPIPRSMPMPMPMGVPMSSPTSLNLSVGCLHHTSLSLSARTSSRISRGHGGEGRDGGDGIFRGGVRSNVALAARVVRSMLCDARDAATVALTVADPGLPTLPVGTMTLTSRLSPASRAAARESRHSETTPWAIQYVTLQSCGKTQPKPRLLLSPTMGAQCVCKLALVPSRNQSQPSQNLRQSVQCAAILFAFPQESHHFLPNVGSDRFHHLARPL